MFPARVSAGVGSRFFASLSPGMTIPGAARLFGWSYASISVRARAKMASNIAGVRRPVFVFSREQ